MVNGQQVNDVAVGVEGIDDTLVANAEPEAVGTGQVLVREAVGPPPQLLNLGLDLDLDLHRQLEEAAVEPLVINLEGRAHRPAAGCRLSGPRRAACRQVAFGLLKVGLELVGVKERRVRAPGLQRRTPVRRYGIRVSAINHSP
jgi:hypothetical protein